MNKDVTNGAADKRESLIQRALDPDHMLALMQDAIAPLAAVPVRVIQCKSKTKKLKAKKPENGAPFEIVYFVVLESETGQKWTRPVLATLPVTPGHLESVLANQHGVALRSTMARPFARLTTYVPQLQMAIQLLPLDPGLPGLMEVTGPRQCEFLAQYLPECRAGARVQEVHTELRQYNRGTRAVLRSCASFTGAEPAPPDRAVYVKIFADDRGAENYERMRSIWDATRDATYFHMPEPLGYAPDLRTLIMEEAPGNSDLVDWIQVLEAGEPLPADVNRERLEQCMVVVARTLAEIHGCAVQLADCETYRGELEGRLEDFQSLRRLEPRFAELVKPLLDRLEAMTPEHEELVCSHGGFRHKQMKGNEHHLTIVDWDGMTMAHPAFDASGFLSHLRQESVRDPGNHAMLEHMAQAFRREFLACEPRVAPRDLALYEAMAFAKKACRAYRRKIRDEEQFAERARLIPAAHELLDAAAA